jgi:serine phosphatase RsbU (regulator of sigma subunit)
LEHAVRTADEDSANGMLAHIRTDVELFMEHEEPHDDMTIVIVQV